MPEAGLVIFDTWKNCVQGLISRQIIYKSQIEFEDTVNEGIQSHKISQFNYKGFLIKFKNIKH